MFKLLQSRTNWWHLLGTIALTFFLSVLAFVLLLLLYDYIFGGLNLSITSILVVFGIPLFAGLIVLYLLGNSSKRTRPDEAKSYLITGILLVCVTVFFTYRPLVREFRSKSVLGAKEERVKYLLEKITNQKDGKPDQESAKELVSLLADITGEWQELKSDSGNFSILFPPYDLESKQTTYLLDGRNLIVNHYTQIFICFFSMI